MASIGYVLRHEELRRRRKALKMTQAELARRMLVTTRTIQNYEAGGKQHPFMMSGWAETIEEAETAAVAALCHLGEN